MEPGKRKKRVHYTLMVVSDSPDGKIQPFCLELKMLTFLLCAAAALLLISLGVAFHHDGALKKIHSEEQSLRSLVDELTRKNQALETENSELSDKVAILSNKVTQDEETKKVQEQEAEERRMPKGFPLAGPAVILQSSETEKTEQEDTREDGSAEPIVVFSASEGIRVIATGSGTVEAVETDEVYGYRITVDHGNGYRSVYRIAEKPLVSGGDEIESGTALYELKTSDEKLGYQIEKDGSLIDPLDLLEVYG